MCRYTSINYIEIGDGIFIIFFFFERGDGILVKCTTPFQLSSTIFALNNAYFEESDSEGVINSFNTKNHYIYSSTLTN